MTAPPKKYSLSDADYARFRELVSRKSGLDFAETRRPDLERVILQTVSELSLTDADALFRLLTVSEQTGTLLETLIARLTVGETYFFRNRPQFEALEQHILPDLINRRRNLRMLRLWSAGCASGEEPYSLAILLKRLLPDLNQWHILILATDINREAMEKAQQGDYGQWSFRDVPADVQALYFTPTTRGFEVVPHIRKMVTFGYLNLADDIYPSLLTNTQAMDLILCRNVLIYFREETTRRVVERFHRSLTDGGWLVVGHAEPSQAIFHQFAVHNFPGTVIYQKEAPKVAEISLPSAPPPAFNWNPPPALAPRSPAPSFGSSNNSTTGHRVADESALYDQAMALWEAGQVSKALGILTKLSADNPADARAPYLAAKIYANRLQLDEAEQWVELALKRAPLMAQAHYMRGLILQEGGRYWEALEALRGCIYADPQFVLGHFALAGQFAKLEQHQRARKALENVTQLLNGHQRDELVTEGDGLTVGRLLDLVTLQKDL